MAFTHLWDGAFPMAPTRQVCSIVQNTEVLNVSPAYGTPQYLSQNVHGSDVSGNQWIAFSRPIFGFELWTTHNASIRILLYLRSDIERDWRGWRLYKNIPNVLTGYELPPYQFKVQLYSDEAVGSTINGFVSVRSL